MEKYTIRINICDPYDAPASVKTEGQFFWLKDQDIRNMTPGNPLEISPKGWSTVAYEVIPYVFLPKITKKQWELAKTENGDLCFKEPHALYYCKETKQYAYFELMNEDGVVLDWDPEDKLPKKNTFTLFGDGRVMCETSSAESLANYITSMIIANHNNYPRRKNLPAEKK